MMCLSRIATDPRPHRGLGFACARPRPRPRLPPSASSNGSSGPPSGRNNRLAPKETYWTHRPSTSGDNPSEPPTAGPLSTLRSALADAAGRLLYRYYNWRTDTLSDLQLFVALNVAVVAGGAWLRSAVVTAAAVESPLNPASEALESGIPTPPSWWPDLYGVLLVVLGQELPDQATAWPQQVFAVATAVLGVASFALVLALIEQATLELLEANVRRGSRVYETNHYVLLTWGRSARDTAAAATLLRQLLAAHDHKSESPAVVVVLSAYLEKLDAEMVFREAVPEAERRGGRIVCRQGSPLDPRALAMVGVTDARAVVIAGDYSRPPEDADAQVLRAAVLVDEAAAAAGREWGSTGGSGDGLTTPPTSRHSPPKRGPWVVAETQGPGAAQLLRYACSDRVLPVPTGSVIARRYARLVRHPVVATLSHALFDNTSRGYCHMAFFPPGSPAGSVLIGRPFASLGAFFPSAIVAGVVDVSANEGAPAAQLNPPPDRPLRPGEGLILLCSAADEGSRRPKLHPSPAYRSGFAWDPESYVPASMDEAPLGRSGEGCTEISCPWLVRGSPIDSACSSDQNTGSFEGERKLEQGGNGADRGHGNSRGRTLPGFMPHSGPRAAPPRASAVEKRGGSLRRRRKSPTPPLTAAVLPLRYDTIVPGASLGVDLLICGWAGAAFMGQILTELDSGVEALPPGSAVVLANGHPWDELAALAPLNSLQNLQLRHVRCDPRNRAALGAAIDVSTLRAAMVMHDTLWTSGAASKCVDISNQTQTTSSDASPYCLNENDMLRVDACTLEVQLNVRYLLAAAGCPDINIISEKMTPVGQSRFEDRLALPLGAAVNSASFSAKVLARVAYQPCSLAAYARLGIDADIDVRDAGEFAAEGEVLSFAALQARVGSVRQVLLGWYLVPGAAEEALQVTVNPEGEEERAVERVWNAGDARCKLILLAPRAAKGPVAGGGSASVRLEREGQARSVALPSAE